jgi:hypothetical protein
VQPKALADPGLAKIRAPGDLAPELGCFIRPVTLGHEEALGEREVLDMAELPGRVESHMGVEFLDEVISGKQLSAEQDIVGEVPVLSRECNAFS